MIPWLCLKKFLIKKPLKSPPIWRGNEQATATPRACYVCSKPTAVCLATTNAIDFLYACEAHLSDTGFATELVDPGSAAAAAAAAKEAVSKEEIERIKAEWEAKEARKKEKDKGKGKDKDKDSKAKSGGKDAGGEDEKEEGGGKKGAKSPSPSATSPTAAGSGSTTPTHKRYSLHRDFFAMRQAEHRRRKQTNQMQELAPRLPGAPRGSLVGWQTVMYSMLLSLCKMLYIPRSINNDYSAMMTGNTLKDLQQHGNRKTWISEWIASVEGNTIVLRTDCICTQLRVPWSSGCSRLLVHQLRRNLRSAPQGRRPLCGPSAGDCARVMAQPSGTMSTRTRC
jgi:hypothetical protein